MKLKGRRALVTGGQRGIGRGVVEIFAEEGADVAINYVVEPEKAESLAQWVEDQGRKSMTVKADVSKRAEVEAMFDKVRAEFGVVDILVNNAGIETIVPFLELTDTQWTDLVNVNLRGPWLCSQVFCRHLLGEKEKKRAAIVHIGSVQAERSLPGRTHYAPTKRGLEALTRNMSTEVAPLGIRVNCVHPGLIETDMTDWVMKADFLPQILAGISLGRAGQPREIGTVVSFLASEDAGYVTGQSIYVEGGWLGK